MTEGITVISLIEYISEQNMIFSNDAISPINY